MKMAANTAVARDSAVVAPRAPNTVPEAPAPKPAPASAPLPRWSSTRPTITNADSNCTAVRMLRNHIGRSHLPGPGGGQDRQEFVGLERGATDQSAVDVRHREQLGRVARLDAATVEDARGGRDSSIPGGDAGADEGVHLLGLLRA